MKKLLSLFCMAALTASAQPYGEQLYPHNTAFCSSGTNVTINSTGFLMSSYVQTAAAGSPNFFIDKTGPGGTYTGLLPFSKAYQVFGVKACSSPTAQGKNVSGIDAIEATTTPTLNAWYALAGAYEEGCFFGTLSSTGNVLTKGLYPFPATTPKPTKPIIIKALTSGQYFICGAFNNASFYMMYILQVDENANVINSQFYYNTSRSFFPADMVLSPYTPSGTQELIVVGEADDLTGSSGTRGFMMRVKALSIPAVISYAEYGHAPGTTGKDAFGCISVAASTSNGGNGFVIGGATDISPNNGMVWALKVDPTGTVFRWNKILSPITNVGARPMVSIVERFSSAYGYTYFGAVKASNGSMVLKLDDNGIPFTGIPIDNINEFIYPGPFAQPSSAVDLSFVNTGAGSDVGIQVYGTDPGSTGGYVHFIEAAFNGKSGACGTSTSVTGMLSVGGPTAITAPTITTHPGLTLCTNFLIAVTTLTTPIKVICTSTAVPSGGSNNRTTGIAENSGNSAFKIAPNPVTDKLEITLSASEKDAVEIKLYDYTGRLVKVVSELNYSETNATAIIDMSTLNIESGIYIMNTTINGVRNTQKIIYTKGQ